MANTGLQSWSTTEASNATADSSVNMAEGMAPSAVNNSVRAIMARVKEWLLDNSGTAKTTAGSSNAYTLDVSQGWDTLDDGMTVAFICHETNTSAATLNVESMGAKALQTTWGTDLPAGALVENQIYRASYDAGQDKWALLMPAFASRTVAEAGTSNSHLVPIGRQHYHLGHPKAWGICTEAGAVQDSYNVTSVSDDNTGRATISWATDFVNDTYAPILCTQIFSASSFAQTGAIAAGTTAMRCVNTGGNFEDPTRYNIVAFGVLV